MSSVLDDFAVNELGDLSGGVILWPVELEGLGCGGVVLEHFFEGFTYVNCLHILSDERPEFQECENLREQANSVHACGLM